MKIIYLVLFTLIFTNSSKAQKQIEFRISTYFRGTWGKLPQKYSSLEIYNANNLLIEKRNNISEETYNRTIYEYNNKGQKITETDYYRIDKSGRKKTYVYDENGTLKSMYYQQRNKKADTSLITEAYFYDVAGNMIRKTVSDSQFRGLETWIYAYKTLNEKKKVTEYYDTGKKRKKRKVTVYNMQDLIIAETEGGKKIEYEYSYDTSGEWIKRRVCTKQEKLGMWDCFGEYRTIVSK